MGARCMHHVELPAVIKGRAVLTAEGHKWTWSLCRSHEPGRYAAVTNAGWPQ